VSVEFRKKDTARMRQISNLVNNEVTQTSQLEAWHRMVAKRNVVDNDDRNINSCVKLTGIHVVLVDYVQILLSSIAEYTIFMPWASQIPKISRRKSLAISTTRYIDQTEWTRL